MKIVILNISSILAIFFKECENEAYEDCPIKKGCVHISAPHIYCTILEALDLKPGTSLSFLNIGSGSGYLTCIASEILGPKSLYYGKNDFDMI